MQSGTMSRAVSRGNLGDEVAYADDGMDQSNDRMLSLSGLNTSDIRVSRRARELTVKLVLVAMSTGRRLGRLLTCHVCL